MRIFTTFICCVYGRAWNHKWTPSELNELLVGTDDGFKLGGELYQLEQDTFNAGQGAIYKAHHPEKGYVSVLVQYYDGVMRLIKDIPKLSNLTPKILAEGHFYKDGNVFAPLDSENVAVDLDKKDKYSIYIMEEMFLLRDIINSSKKSPSGEVESLQSLAAKAFVLRPEIFLRYAEIIRDVQSMNLYSGQFHIVYSALNIKILFDEVDPYALLLQTEYPEKKCDIKQAELVSINKRVFEGTQSLLNKLKKSPLSECFNRFANTYRFDTRSSVEKRSGKNIDFPTKDLGVAWRVFEEDVKHMLTAIPYENSEDLLSFVREYVAKCDSSKMRGGGELIDIASLKNILHRSGDHVERNDGNNGVKGNKIMMAIRSNADNDNEQDNDGEEDNVEDNDNHDNCDHDYLRNFAREVWFNGTNRVLRAQLRGFVEPTPEGPEGPEDVVLLQPRSQAAKRGLKCGVVSALSCSVGVPAGVTYAACAYGGLVCGFSTFMLSSLIACPLGCVSARCMLESLETLIAEESS